MEWGQWGPREDIHCSLKSPRRTGSLDEPRALLLITEKTGPPPSCGSAIPLGWRLVLHPPPRGRERV